MRRTLDSETKDPKVVGQEMWKIADDLASVDTSQAGQKGGRVQKRKTPEER